LIHPANDAKKELLGCIASVTIQTGIGKGSGSRIALEQLKALVYKALANNEEVKIKIQSKKLVLSMW
jgi:histidinol phosphatase-like enzyme